MTETKQIKFKKSRDLMTRRSGSEKVVCMIATIVLGLLASTYVLAFLWGAMAACKTHEDLILHPWSFPEVWQVRNYIDAFKLLKVDQTNMIGMIFNSLWLVLGGSVLNVMGGTLMAYAVTKYRFVGRKLLIGINLIIMTLPIVGSLPSQYALYKAFGFINSPLILIAYFGGFGSINLYMCACFRGISWSYAEAAQIDGARHFTVLFKVMLPLAKGTITALLIIQMVAIWNDYNTALLFLPKMPTLATGIYLFNRDMVYQVRMDILMAATVLSALPPLILYACCYKSVLKNVSIGGLKG